jgi:Uma2 family endonuclease
MSAAIALTPATNTLEEYLALEERAYQEDWDERYEYLGGEIYAMAGASPRHNKVVARTFFELTLRLRPKGCEVVTADQRVKARGNYIYPDLVVTCGDERFDDSVNPPILLNPLLLVEVLSPSTKSRDLTEKLEEYLEIESLAEYWIISTDKPLVRQYARREEGWLLVAYRGLDAALPSDHLGLDLPLAAIYDGITFEKPGADESNGEVAE